MQLCPVRCDTIDELYRILQEMNDASHLCWKRGHFIVCLTVFSFLMFIMQLCWTCKSNTRCNVQYQQHKDIFLLHAFKKAYPHICPLLRVRSGWLVRLQVPCFSGLSITSSASWSTGSIFMFILKDCNHFILFIIWWICKYCFDVRTRHVLYKGLVTCNRIVTPKGVLLYSSSRGTKFAPK